MSVDVTRLFGFGPYMADERAIIVTDDTTLTDFNQAIIVGDKADGSSITVTLPTLATTGSVQCVYIVNPTEVAVIIAAGASDTIRFGATGITSITQSAAAIGEYVHLTALNSPTTWWAIESQGAWEPVT